MRGVFVSLGALFAAACSVIGDRGATPTPSYEVVETLGEAVEIRRYGARALVEARMEDGGRNDAFSLLFDYITGANDGGARIAMTAPVSTNEGVDIAMTAPVSESAGGDYAMRFFLPDDLSAESAPRPTDPRLTVREAPEQIIATYRFSGSRGEEAVATAREALRSALDGSGWVVDGAFESWFYDPPWTIPALRRNEIAAPVRPVS